MSGFAHGFESGPPDIDGRLDAPAFHRNHEPIWSALAPWLPQHAADVLEIGSGTGQHVVAFARKAPHIVWWPTDLDEAHLGSIEAWRRDCGLGNIRPARPLDLTAPDWGLNAADSDALRGLAAILCANVIHISPWQAAEGLFGRAAGRLRRDGHLFLYGPFKRDGRHTAPSNAAFDASLRASDPSWGVRDISDVASLAERSRLVLADTVPMPANNLMLRFSRDD